jgi:hypothetical protein
MKSLSKDYHTSIAKLITSAVTLLVVSAPFVMNCEAHSQPGQAPATIVVAEELRVDAGTEAPLGIDVRGGNAPPNQLLLLIQGLPTAIALSHGRLFDSGVWALRINDLPKLKIATQRASIGNSNLSLSLVGLDGTVLTQSHSRLVIVPPRAGGESAENALTQKDTRQTAAPISPEKPERAAEQTASLPPAGLKPITAEDTVEAKQLMVRGDENLRTGKIIVARKFYQRAVDYGWAPAALALARTYDPQEFSKIGVIGGIKPDPQLAKMWYERARDMGLREAADRLQQLGNR